MEMIEVDGLRIAYERADAGPPLVLLHGYVGDGTTTWRPQIEGLSDEFTVVAWDAPGAGRSSDPPESFGLAGYADCLARFVDRLGLEKPHVAGLSFGGALALEFYRRHSAIPMTLILASAYAGWAGSLPADVAAQRLQQALVLANLSPEEFVGALLPTCSVKAHPRSPSMSSPRPCWRSIRLGSGPWRVRLQRTCVTHCPTSESRRCWFTATRTCGRP
jgi:pimeloyl-ACP methyl ester carboxylesterase